MTLAERMTADEYLVMGDERWGMELIAGEVVVEEANLAHQRAVMEIQYALHDWIRAGEDRGEVILPIDVKLDDHNVFGPDLLWYGPENGPAEDRPRPHPMPDLAVEVRSPATWRYDLGHKKSMYESHGLRELWLVDVDAASVLVFRRSLATAPSFDVALELMGDDTLASPLLHGFGLTVAQLFRS